MNFNDEFLSKYQKKLFGFEDDLQNPYFEKIQKKYWESLKQKIANNNFNDKGNNE